MDVATCDAEFDSLEAESGSAGGCRDGGACANSDTAASFRDQIITRLAAPWRRMLTVAHPSLTHPIDVTQWGSATVCAACALETGQKRLNADIIKTLDLGLACSHTYGCVTAGQSPCARARAAAYVERQHCL